MNKVISREYVEKNYIHKDALKKILENLELPNIIVGGRSSGKTLEFGKKLGKVELIRELLKEETKDANK